MNELQQKIRKIRFEIRALNEILAGAAGIELERTKADILSLTKEKRELEHTAFVIKKSA